MFKYILSFLWALPFFISYYLINDAAFHNIQVDLNERFSFNISGSFDQYALIYFVSDYFIINLTNLGFFAAIKNTERPSYKSVSIISAISSVVIIFCHAYLLQLDLIASYYTITCLMAIGSFIYLFTNRKGALVGNFLLSMTSFVLYLFIAFIHFIYIYYNFFNIVENISKQDKFTFNMIKDSIDSNNFALVSKKYGIEYDYETNTITKLSQLPESENKRVDTGIKNMILDLKKYDAWSNSFLDIETDKTIDKNHTITKITKINGTYLIEKYVFKVHYIQDLYGQFFMVIYFSILGFLSVWLTGVFKLMIVHKHIKIK